MAAPAKGAKFTFYRAASQGFAAERTKACPHPNPLPEGEGTDGGDLARYIDLNNRRDLRLGQAKFTTEVASRRTSPRQLGQSPLPLGEGQGEGLCFYGVKLANHERQEVKSSCDI